MVIAAARHYWNAIKPFIVEPIERELLREPMEAVLECIAAVAANEVGKGDEVRQVINRQCLRSLPCTSVSKRVFLQNLSYENKFGLNENYPVG